MNKSYLEEEYRRMHQKGAFTGGSLAKHVDEIKKLVSDHDVKTLLDYGCGKAKCHNEKLASSVTLYDPYCEPYTTHPEGTFDMVICTDVLEHVPEDEVGPLLHKLMHLADKVLFLAISTRPARKTFTNGENVHVTVRPKEWWEGMLETMRDIKIVRHYS